MAQFVEMVFRSRQTLLDILRERGYDTAGAEKYGPEEIRAALAATPNGKGLTFTVKAREGAVVPTPNVRVYIFLWGIKNKLPGFLASLEPSPGIDEEEDTKKDKLGSPVDPAQTSVICLLNEPVVAVFNQASASAWATRNQNLRLSFFAMRSFQFNPLKHYLVPKHEIVPADQKESLLRDMYVKDAKQLPLIRYHEDPITRVIGAIPGDIIKITRPSPSAGEYVIYRACV
jgi:DNA-directed RNA polymerase subunit H